MRSCGTLCLIKKEISVLYCQFFHNHQMCRDGVNVECQQQVRLDGADEVRLEVEVFEALHKK